MPKPCRFDAPVTEAVIVVRVTRAQRRDIEQIARENHNTISGFIREATDEAVSDYRERRVFSKRNTDCRR
ncbi:MAG: hypothetical protein RLZZ524_2926 [Pseudomonadota bacterium]|jgi:hypothetical protein